MAIKRYSLQQVVHYIVKPVVLSTMIYIANSLRLAGEPREWSSVLVKNLDSAFHEIAREIEPQDDKMLKEAIRKLGHAACLILDVEPEYREAWWKLFISKLKKYDLCDV